MSASETLGHPGPDRPRLSASVRKRCSPIRTAMQLGLLGVALGLSVLGELGRGAILGVAVAGAAALLARWSTPGKPGKMATAAFCLGCVGTVAFFLGLLASVAGAELLDGYHALIATSAAGTMLLSRSEATGKRWPALAAAWAFGGSGLWLAGAYLRNDTWPFFGNGAALLAGSILLVVQRRRAGFGPFLARTLLLLLIALPLTNVGVAPAQPKPRTRDSLSATNAPAGSFAANPEEWGKWWADYMDQWARFGDELTLPDPQGQLPYRLKPNSRMWFGKCLIQVNSLGFRGPEFALDKAGAYRIVCLGESTTFGATLDPNDVPWPEILEGLIRERLKTDRPVQVVNAGLPGFHLLQNLVRLRRDILPLKPDLIVSYHGFNGFHLLNTVLPPTPGVGPTPTYKNRPIHLLANVEYRLRLWLYHRRHLVKSMLSPREVPRPLETPYARGYEELIATCRTQGIQLALCDYSMAMNWRNPTATGELHRTTFPHFKRLVQANGIHTVIVRDLVKRHPETRYVETHTNLDGDADKFLDLIHFRQAGRQQLAENVFAGISNILVKPK